MCASCSSSLWAFATLACFTLLAASVAQSQELKQEVLSSYIVHVSPSHRPSAFASSPHWFASTLASLSGLPISQSLLLHGPFYSYESVFHGFLARLSPSQASRLLGIPGFLWAVPDKLLQLHTTHTPEFLGLSDLDGLSTSSDFGRDVIVGVIDTGVWPERESFSDAGFDDVPSRWKGVCEEGTEFNASNCNKKLIGARAFYKGYEASAGPIDESSEYKSARDSEGHGTHTSSTAAGNLVTNASLFGYAPGDARGMAPGGRLAVYKVCWEPGCYDSDILAAFEAAVEEGVDVISLSVGGSVVPFYFDSIAIGSFGAMKKGIVVSCSAGNSGPYAGSVTNVAPWILTVGASTVDRTFPAPILLGNGQSISGAALYGGKGFPEAEQLSLVYAGDAGVEGSSKSYLCMSGTLDEAAVAGKLVLCDRGTNARVTKGLVVKNAGGVGMILANTAESGEEVVVDSHLLPASAVGYDEGVAIKAYLSSTGSNATATIAFNGTDLGVKPAPALASFSSRGPNPLPPQILKPDLTAPGVNILAGYTGAIGPTGLSIDDRIVEFTIMSGTSMSCPHVSGLAALLKGAHPDWSPAAIKSALMTSASSTDNTGNCISDSSDSEPSDAFGYGAGHVNPEDALDPGLVYDLSVQDYVDFLCSLGYDEDELEVFTSGDVNCSSDDLRLEYLNYPSFAWVFAQGGGENVTFSRTVTNVGTSANATYTVEVSPPFGLTVTVDPETLEFGEELNQLSYKVTLDSAATSTSAVTAHSSSSSPQDQHVFGSLTWTDGSHVVRSSIAVTFSVDQSQHLLG